MSPYCVYRKTENKHSTSQTVDWVCLELQDNRERERQLASDIGKQVMLEAFAEDDLEMTKADSAQMNITASFNDLEDQPADQEDGWQGQNPYLPFLVFAL